MAVTQPSYLYSQAFGVQELLQFWSDIDWISYVIVCVAGALACEGVNRIYWRRTRDGRSTHQRLLIIC